MRKLVEAGQDLESIFWRQSDPEGLALYQALANCPGATEKQIQHYLLINGNRYDLLEGNKPFLANDRIRAGPRAVSRRNNAQGDRGLRRRASREESRDLQPVDGRQAAAGRSSSAFRITSSTGNGSCPRRRHSATRPELSDDKAFANFLRLRADALLSDDYYKSDLAWVDLDNHKFDVIMAPYETYLDDLLGVKTSYGVAVMIRNPVESAKLTMYKQYAAAIQDALPIPAADVRRTPDIRRQWKSWTRRIVPAICDTAIRRSPTISPTIRASTPRRARRRCSSRTSWTRA